MALKQAISYDKRNFQEIREQLINFTKQYYPDLISSFNDSSIYSLLVELNAAVADQLNFTIDRNFQETQLQQAQEKRSLFGHAANMGLKIGGKKPAITIVDFSVTVPTFGDTFSKEYLPILKPGTQAIGAGKVYETTEEIDFSSPFGRGGAPNRLIIPNIDANDKIQNYKITKRELVINGVSKIFKRVITAEDIKPFFEIILPDKDVISIEQCISLEGTNFIRTPTIDEFLDDDRRFFEVEHLAQDSIFKEDFTRVSDRSGVVPGTWKTANKRFIKEYTPNGFCKITFGSDFQSEIYENVIKGTGFETQLGDFLNNNALGQGPVVGTTIFIRYRVGGGADSNIGRNVLTEVGNVNMTVDGPRADINRSVRTSLEVSNPVPGLGGKDELSIEEMRKLISYNFSSQLRTTTVRDYMSQIMKIPGKFGSAFRNSCFEEQNKVKVKILALDENGKLDNTSTQTLKENIAEYLTEFRMLNDYVEVSDGRVINLSFEFDLFIDQQFSQSEIASNVISVVTDELDIKKHTMNENIYIGNLIEKINNQPGVINIIETRIFNKVGGGKYSLNEISQELLNNNTRQIKLIDFTLFGEPSSMFEIKFPEKDIKVFVKSGRITI